MTRDRLIASRGTPVPITPIRLIHRNFIRALPPLLLPDISFHLNEKGHAGPWPYSSGFHAVFQAWSDACWALGAHWIFHRLAVGLKTDSIKALVDLLIP